MAEIGRLAPTVGNALKEIRDDKLYRSSHGTFAAYVGDRFGFEKRHAYRLIDASDVARNVSHGAQIVSERQAREVAKAPPRRVSVQSTGLKLTPQKTNLTDCPDTAMINTGLG